MYLKSTLAGALMATASVAVAPAQQPTTSAGTVITSEPGRAAVMRTQQASAEVVRIDKATRTVTLKGAQGDTIEIVAGDDVKNFDQIKLGDIVVARYTIALALKLRKTKGPPEDVSVSEGSSVAKPGEEPSFTGGRQVTAVAEVVAVDPKESTIKLKGPKGNVVTLDVRNPDQFKVVKEGDQVEVTYTEAVALSVEPASK
jgi:hypothetical protein